MKKLTAALLVATTLFSTAATAKKVLDHDSFDAWKSVRTDAVTDNGAWAAYEVNPQEGDGTLTLRETRTGREISIPRGYSPRFTADGKWAVVKIKPFYAATRKAKIDKKKDYDMPQDSLAIVSLTERKVVEKVPQVVSYGMGRTGGDLLVYTVADTAYIAPKALKSKDTGLPMVVRRLGVPGQQVVKWVKDYTVSADGKSYAASTCHHKSDSTAVDAIVYGNPSANRELTLEPGRKSYSAPVINEAGTALAFTATDDTLKSGTKRAQLYLARLTDSQPKAEEIVVAKSLPGKINLQRPNEAALPEAIRDSVMNRWAEQMRREQAKDLYINQYSKPQFSRNGKRLIIGVAPAVAPDDTTIVDFERAELDIWRWDAPYTPPQENHNVDKARKQTLPVAIDLSSMQAVLVADDMLQRVDPSWEWNADVALVHDPSEYITTQQWDYAAPEQLSVVNLTTGQKTPVAMTPIDNSEFSPNGKYVLWYTNRHYYAYDVATGKTVCLTESIPYPVWDEEQDIPMERQNYGVGGWVGNDEAVLIYDRHDIWSIDPSGNTKPVNLTAGEGRKQNRRYRYLKLDHDQQSIPADKEMFLSLFDYTDKRHGYATLPNARKAAAPQTKELDTYTYSQLRKAKDAPTYIYQKSNFSTSPDLYIANGGDFGKAKRVTDANPQMKEYNWGDAQLVKWHAYNGIQSEGVLYTPEDLDPTKKYPMLVVFYERNSEQLYRHYTMEPSWSWVNYPFYVSRGYVVFVPDVKYAPGIPGESAYNYICSGVEELCRRYPWIDKDKIGIDGQSWGGYQTAFLITRTNMFACAGSGAPVANMTSAFGGIRWESGSSRQPQYEQGQSRIGRNLWEAPQLYIANSPVFYADRVNTPLLIMHNDGDGAVPWYQGIELFMALRRLQKPVWMLQYNGEAHNIRARKNRKDITIRLQQFFDHYLKDAPMPEWMKYGIPATRKGQEMRTGLVTE